ncbi:MAG: leucine-rich repeat domain-containing protein, partial [Clostridia bacterium]|nr:leucine-rich repeat domain-containing protein [Clostridia bacterium]
DCTALESITLPDSLRSLGRESFRGCTALRTLTIPDSVTEIGEDAFAGCGALTVTAPHEAGYYTDKPDDLTADIADWVVA